jgi:hypothetical protein
VSSPLSIAAVSTADPRAPFDQRDTFVRGSAGLCLASPACEVETGQSNRKVGRRIREQPKGGEVSGYLRAAPFLYRPGRSAP